MNLLVAMVSGRKVQIFEIEQWEAAGRSKWTLPVDGLNTMMRKLVGRMAETVLAIARQLG